MRANRIDDNQRAIIEALRRRGHLVQELNAVKNGVPDLLVGARVPRLLSPHQVPPGLAPEGARIVAIDKRLRLLEVKVARNKRGDLEPLNEAEAKWHRQWVDFQPVVVGSVEEAIAAVES